MTTSAFLLDLSKCIGCSACVAACKIGNQLPQETQYIQIGENSRGSYPNVLTGLTNARCYHCADAACVSVCPTGALYKQDGMTRVQADLCSACEYCVSACPFSIPEVENGHVHKCDGCADVVAAGGTPWCVKTCPNGALAFGQRDEILAEAKQRVAKLKGRYPEARVYGESEAGGLGMIIVLPHEPELYDLPKNPQTQPITGAWQKVVQPASLGLTGLSLVVTGLAAVIARRNHLQEVDRLNKAIRAAENEPEEKAHDNPQA